MPCHRLQRALALAIALATASGGSAVADGGEITSFASVKSSWRSSELTITDRFGEPLQSQRVDAQSRRLTWVAFNELSPALVDALLAAEDQRFHAHKGVDWQAVAQSMWDNLSRDRARGASTITMQLAALMDSALAIEGGRRSAAQKLSQALAARQIEQRWRKDEILEAYLNLTSFRGELTGIDAASEALFGVGVRHLNRTDAGLLAALVRGPNANANVVAQRACTLNQRLQAHGTPVPTCEATRLRAEQTLGTPYRLSPRYNEAPHFGRWLVESASITPASNSYKTSLIAAIQRVANASLRQHLAEMSSRNMRDASVLVLDNATGEIIAYVGGGGALSRAPQLDLVRTKRQAGSTLKPFIYGAAFDARLMTAASLIDDSPTGFAAGSGLYAPQNYDRVFKGWVSARTALAGSLNIPAVKALDVLGQERGYGTLAKLGLEVTSESPDFYGYALALGSVDVSLANLTNAYRALAQGGRTSHIVSTVGAPSPTTRVLSADAAFIVSDILADPSARAITFGSDSVLATRVWAAVKTGTSKDLRDNWCIGFSDRYTVGVWVGNADGTPMKDVSGVAGAAPIWADVMHALHRDTASRAPAPPGDLQRTEVTFANGLEPRRREWFLRGTERTHVAIAAPTNRTVRIVYPTPGLIIAQDPDIPKGRERVPVDLSGAVGAVKVKHNGRWLQTAYLAPTPGRHTLELVAATGEVLQRVAFEVR